MGAYGGYRPTTTGQQDRTGTGQGGNGRSSYGGYTAPAPVYTNDQWRAYGGGSNGAQPTWTPEQRQANNSARGRNWVQYGANYGSQVGPSYADTIAAQLAARETYAQGQDYKNALALLGAANGPQNAALEAQKAALEAQKGITTQKTGLSKEDITNKTNALLAQLAVERSSGGDQLQSADRQQALLDQIYQLQLQGSSNTEGKLNEDLGFAGRDRDIAIEGQDINLKTLIQKALENRRGARSDAVVRGAYSTEGHAATQRDITTGENLGKEGIENNRKSIFLSYDKQTSDIQAALRQTFLDREELGLNHKEQVAQIEDRRKALFREAQKIGINEDQAAKDLENGLKQLELDHQTSMNQLLTAIASKNAEQAAAAQQIAQQAMAMASQNAAMRAATQQPAGYTPQEMAFFAEVQRQKDLEIWNAAVARNNQTTAQQGAAAAGRNKMSKLN